jgi:hypothetical protein
MPGTTSKKGRAPPGLANRKHQRYRSFLVFLVILSGIRQARRFHHHVSATPSEVREKISGPILHERSRAEFRHAPNADPGDLIRQSHSSNPSELRRAHVIRT